MRYQWILFDADGTLFDYDAAERVAIESTFRDFGHAFEPRFASVYKEVNRLTWLEFERGEITQDRLRSRRFERLFVEVGIEEEASRFGARYLERLSERADLVEGSLEILAYLRGKVRLVLVTNGLAEVQRSRLARSPIAEFFETFVISEEVGSAKPDRKIFDVARQGLGDPPLEQGLIVGDSLTSDIRGGSDYGIGTCWFNPQRHDRPAAPPEGPRIDHEVATLDEIEGLL